MAIFRDLGDRRIEGIAERRDEGLQLLVGDDERRSEQHEVAVHAVRVARARVEQEAALPSQAHDGFDEPGRPRERRTGRPIGDQLQADQQPATADLADVGVVPQSLVQQRAEPCALGGARLDEPLALEDAQHLAGDGRAHD